MSYNGEGKLFSSIAATTAAFTLAGGTYTIAAIATWTAGSAELDMLGPDGSTYLSVGTSTHFTANGIATVQLPPGQYKITIATATGVYVSITRVPT